MDECIIDFNNINNDFNYGSELKIFVYNENDELIEQYNLYTKMFSSCRIFSLNKPARLIASYLLFIYVNSDNIAFLIEESDNEQIPILYFGIYENKKFISKTNVLYINKDINKTKNTLNFIFFTLILVF